jgi:ribose transport system permease protein
MKFKQRLPIIAAMTVIALITGIIEPNFLSLRNATNIVVQSTSLAVVAAGMTFVIIAGGIDLSVGAIAAFSAMILGQISAMTGSIYLAVLGALGAGAIVGCINAFFVCRVGISPFLATLGVMGLARGAAFLTSNGMPLSGVAGGLTILFRQANLPYGAYAWFMLIATGTLMLEFTVWGRYIYAVGSNNRAALLVGIDVQRIQVQTYVLAGILAALSGILITARLDSAQPMAGNLYELDAIGAVVIGGGSLAGGRGDLIGTSLGVLLIIELRNAVTIIGLPSNSQPLIIGAVLLAAVALDRKQSSQRKGE